LCGRGFSEHRLIECDAPNGVLAEQHGYRPVQFALQFGGRLELAFDRLSSGRVGWCTMEAAAGGGRLDRRSTSASIDQRVDRSVLGAGAFDPFLAFGHGRPCCGGAQAAVADIVQRRRIGLRLRDGRIFSKSILRQGGFSGLGKAAARDRAAVSTWRQSAFCRLQAAILPFFDASSSYDTR